MATTLLLDRIVWDLCLDASGNMAVASEPYSRTQDVASECRVFAGECYYDTTVGIPYPSAILGQNAPYQLMKEYLVRAAQRVPGVTNAVVYLTALNDREIGGQIQFNGGIVSL